MNGLTPSPRDSVFALPRLLVLVAALSLGGLTGPALGQLPFEGEPINYLTAPVDDPVARLQKKMEQGEVTLKFDEEHGYLASVLEHLGVPASSQVLVFSKTSFQRTRISARKPRALYFGDESYVGWVQNGDVLEIATTDPKQGAVFYLLAQEEDAKPTFQRQTHDCLQCHVSSKTRDVPGHLIRSVYPDRSGQPVYNAGTFTTGLESPLSERWGGWYVTGTHGKQRHMGNVFVTDFDHPEQLDTDAGANLTDLSGLIKTDPYLVPDSDIVALMAIGQQAQIHNVITQAGFQARQALHYQAGLNKALGEPADYRSESTDRRIKNAAEALVRALLFVDEAPLTDPIAGTSGFAQEFAARGPRDSRGRSLRDLDLKRRLFAYPCSYLIYTEAFDALPKPVLDHVSARLREVLTAEDPGPEFAHLSAADRRAILEILRDTKPGLLDD